MDNLLKEEKYLVIRKFKGDVPSIPKIRDIGDGPWKLLFWGRVQKGNFDSITFFTKNKVLYINFLNYECEWKNIINSLIIK